MTQNIQFNFSTDSLTPEEENLYNALQEMISKLDDNPDANFSNVSPLDVATLLSYSYVFGQSSTWSYSFPYSDLKAREKDNWDIR